MFCPDCGKELDEDITICDGCGYDFLKQKSESEFVENKRDDGSIKTFILNTGRLLIDFDTVCGIVFAILVAMTFWSTVIGSFIPDKNGYLENIRTVPLFMILAIVVPIIILIWIVLTKYILYLLIDIRDSLVELKQQNKDK